MGDGQDFESAVSLLEGRCAAIDKHYERFPNSLDRTMADTARAMRAVIEEAKSLRARHSTILASDCACCVLTRAACADTLAEFAVARKAA